MPKEVVYGSEPIDAESRPVAVVRWSRETGDVQLVTRELTHEVPGPDEDDPIPCQYGYYCTLDRRGINDMIRILRRARNAAFGADE